MANQLAMAKINAIHTLHKSGHSNRKIAKLLGIDRGTVGKYVSGENPPNAPRSGAAPGPPSDCHAWREVIVAKLEQGLSAKRIHQDLIDEHGCTASYYSVRRFIAKLGAKTELPVRRMETAAGEETQVDFGTGAWVIDGEGKRRRTWVFRIVLSHSRKAYSEAVYKQSTEAFVQCLGRLSHEV